MSSEFLRILKNSRHSDQNSSVAQKTIRFLNKNSNLKNALDTSQEFFRILKTHQNSCAEKQFNACKARTVYKNLLRG